jgi:hypothetical protein
MSQRSIDNLIEYFNDEEYEWLNFRVSDYADWTLTRKYINKIFPDYL